MVEQYFKTPQAAHRLNVPYSQLMSWIRYGKVAPPRKDSSGDYVWTEADLVAVQRTMDSWIGRPVDNGALAPGGVPSNDIWPEERSVDSESKR